MQNTDIAQIDLLRERIARLEKSFMPRMGSGTRAESGLSSGCRALDVLLPCKGFRPGTLVEWLAYDGEEQNAFGGGTGAASLAFLAAAQALRRSEAAGNLAVVVVLDPWGEFYPPAVARCGIDLARLIVVHPRNQADYHWAFDQALRCSAVAAVIAWPDALGRGNVPDRSSRQRTSIDGHTFRRWQLAAEGGLCLGLMIRPVRVRHEPSWADARILVEPLPSIASHGASRRLRVTVLRARGGMKERTAELEIPM